jgi:hypothetical protein
MLEDPSLSKLLASQEIPEAFAKVLTKSIDEEDEDLAEKVCIGMARCDAISHITVNRSNHVNLTPSLSDIAFCLYSCGSNKSLCSTKVGVGDYPSRRQIWC